MSALTLSGPRFGSLEEMIVATAEAVRPPERITVSQAAERYHIVKNPGQHEGPFSLSKTPYLREPMDELNSLDFTAVAFAGPARTGKSAMAINWLCHTAITDPADMLFVGMSQNVIRDWSQADLAKAIRNSPELRARMSPLRTDDNTYDKHFLSGMRAVLTWPTIKNLSGKTIPRQVIMDLDRIKPQIVDKEAHVFDATRKRGETFKRYAMCLVEGSPGFEVTNPKWVPSADQPNEAPPCEGILSIYNRGDKRRWHWECPQCNGKFEPHFKLLQWPKIDSIDPMEAAEQVVMVCPHDGYPMIPSMQRELNMGGRWIKQGMVWLPDGSIVGTPLKRDIASFWMFGPAAGFTDWTKLVYRYLVALDEYEKTGSEGALMTTVNVDQGDAYLPKRLEGSRLPETLKARAINWGGRWDEVNRCSADVVVPAVEAGGGYLMAMVDVQARSFVVHIYLVSAGNVIWHVDMFKIRKSDRLDADGHPLPIDPAGYPEDWKVLIDRVMNRTYPLNDGSGRRMAIKLTACDSGGKEGVTTNAYGFYRYLQSEMLHQRFHLLKGDPSRSMTDVAMLPAMWDSQKKDKFSIARGDVPGWRIGSNFCKDAINTLMEAPDRVMFPHWAQDWFYSQLTNEVRDPLKGWDNVAGRRNEAFDCLAYCYAFMTHPDIRSFHLDWTNPPSWAGPWDRNDFVFDENGQPAFTRKPEGRKSIAELGDALG